MDKRDQFGLDEGGQFELDERGQDGLDFPVAPERALQRHKAMNTNGDGLRKLGALHSVRVTMTEHESI